MGLHLHSAACEAYLTTPPYDEYAPLDGVEFPRERKPGKRDRHALRDMARVHRNRRCNLSSPLDHTFRWEEFSYARCYRYRLRVIGHLMSPHQYAEEKRYWRCCIANARRFNLVPLPSVPAGTQGEVE